MCQVCLEAATDSRHSSFCQCGSPATLAAMRRIEADISRRQMLGGMSAVVGMFAGFGLAPQEVKAQTPGAPVLLTNLRLFDGETLAMREGVEILIEGERIAALPPVGKAPGMRSASTAAGAPSSPG